MYDLKLQKAPELRSFRAALFSDYAKAKDENERARLRARIRDVDAELATRKD